ncbi:MAG TPA: carbohydrate-binding family 9-like protein [Acidobacteriota bacterium]|nr:carbohydrate-binding family 9-like protein [Acidobacteriota bacterium]
MTQRYGCGEERLIHYTAHRVDGPVRIDGDLDKEPWRNAARSSRFVDLVTGAPALLDTRMAALWDDVALYVGFWIEEPRVQARLTERDAFVWTENDVEVFIGGDDCYYEFQINALGTVYEVFYIWQEAYRRGERFRRRPEFDLAVRSVDVLGGFQDASRCGRHPRGRRWAFMDWDFPGLRAAVRVDGTINDDSDIDRGWTAEIAFPWAGMAALYAGRAWPPREGDVLRLDFSRFEHVDAGGRRLSPSLGWALNPHGVYDSHIPECFSYVHLGGRRTPAPEGARP